MKSDLVNKGIEESSEGLIDWGVRGLRDLGFGEGLGERGIEGLRGRLGYFGRKEMEGIDPKLDQKRKDTEWVLKWVLARIAAFCCTNRYQIWIPEIL